MRLTRIYLLILFSKVLLSPVSAEACRTIRSFDGAQKQNPKETQIRIQLLDGPKDISPVVTVLLQEYLSLSKDLSPAIVSKSNADGSKTGRSYLLKGNIAGGGEGYLLSIDLEDTGEKGGAIIHVDGKFLYPAGLNDALVGAIDQMTKAIKAPLPPKKLLPFLNTTTSRTAYGLYTQAQQSLDAQTWSADVLSKAQKILEGAIEADYNYVPAYLRLAEVLAARGRLEGSDAMKKKALVELAKAKLLLPPLAERAEDKIRWYGSAKDEAVCGDSL